MEEKTNESHADTSFAETILNRMKGLIDKPVPVIKRRKVDMSTKVISNKNYLDVLEIYEKEDEEKRLKKVKLQKERNKRVKKWKPQ